MTDDSMTVKYYNSCVPRRRAVREGFRIHPSCCHLSLDIFTHNH